MAQTVLSGLINPEVVADYVDAKLTDYQRFLPLAEVDDTLSGQAGNTLYFPVYSYIGSAVSVAEGASFTPSALTATSASATILKYAKGVEITDEAMLSAFGSPAEEAGKQLAMALGDALDTAMYNVLSAITSVTGLVYSVASTESFPATTILDALELFGEDVDEVKAVVVSPAMYTEMRKATGWLPASQISAEIMLHGVVGEYGGCQVIVSNKLKNKNEMYIVKPGALRLVQKRGVAVETERDLLHFSTVIAGSIHAVAYLYNSAKAIKVYKSAT